MQIKKRRNRFTHKAGIFLGPRVEVDFLKEHEGKLVEMLGLKLDNFKLQKEIEYELDIKAEYAVIHIVESKIKEVKRKLKKILNDESEILEYYLCLGSNLKDR